MATVTKYCHSVTQTTGGKYVTWSNLGNIRNNTSGAYAVSSVLVKGKDSSPNRPSTITCTNFQFNLPTGAEPTKVTIEYNQSKVVGSDDPKVCNIGAPTISLVGVGGFSGKGIAPTVGFRNRSKSFNIKGKVTRSQVNSSSFGVKINYPANSNSYTGYMRISFVRVTVEYKPAEYSINIGKVKGGYNGDDYTLQLSISNKNRVGYNPSLTLTSPLGFNYQGKSGTGDIRVVNARTLVWNPKLTSKVGTSSINLRFSTDVSFPSGSSSYTGTFTLSESLYGTSKSFNAVITPKPPSESEEDIGSDTPLPDGGTGTVTELTEIKVISGNEFKLDMGEITNIPNISSFDLGFYDIELTDIDYDGTYTIRAGSNPVHYYFEDEDLPVNGNWSITVPKKIRVTYLVEDSQGDYAQGSFYITVIPPESDLTIPFFSMLKLSQEELDRLGNGYTYILQDYMKHTTIDYYETDWYKNNRIGVFNNAISENITIETVEVDGEYVDIVHDSTDYDNLTSEQIFENAEYWSNALTSVNTYESLECEFTYNEDYPFIILFTGDYPETETYGYHNGTVSYTTPCIIEKPVYKEREDTGNYPTPILNLISGDGSTAEQEIEAMNTTTNIIAYDYPLDEGYGNNDKTSIRGLKISGTVDQSDDLVINATLINPDGVTGNRTTIIDQDTETFTLGGLGDNWGFTQSEVHDLEDWELHLTVNNLLNDTVSNINYGDLRLTVYTEDIIPQNIHILIDGEDLGFYGAFIEDAQIPEGLETDTAFLSIDGTDTNDAYRQNIREKTIKLELSIQECDLQTNTDMLRQLTKLLVNEKDEYNRPIPKRIEFSHYPDVYFEYVMEKAMDVSNETGAYLIKAELTIPSGTSFDKEDTTTNITGFVQGLAAVNPYITFKPMDSTINIREELTGQSFNMGYTGDWQSQIVMIDCEDRKVYMMETEEDTQPVDISKYVDFNSDWFHLLGEYSFSGTGCVIRTVTFTERW